jgi:hypothetical protein
MMTDTWTQLKSAVKILANAGNKRDGLTKALHKVVHLQMKDLPAEVRPGFTKLTDRILAYERDSITPEEVEKLVAYLTDAEVASAISLLIHMRDAVAYYQPQSQHAHVVKSRVRPKSRTNPH